jgi:hypothetical protein
MRALDAGDELRIGDGPSIFFSTERLACIEPFPGGDAATFCPRCKQVIESGGAAVRCPACGSWHRQAYELPTIVAPAGLSLLQRADIAHLAPEPPAALPMSSLRPGAERSGIRPGRDARPRFARPEREALFASQSGPPRGRRIHRARPRWRTSFRDWGGKNLTTKAQRTQRKYVVSVPSSETVGDALQEDDRVVLQPDIMAGGAC